MLLLPGRNRWVDYGKKDSDPSQVPPEWYVKSLYVLE